MKTKLLKKLRRQAIKNISIKRDSENNIKWYSMGLYIRTFDPHEFITFVTELWHDEAKMYIDKHKRKTKRESPYIW